MGKTWSSAAAVEPFWLVRQRTKITWRMWPQMPRLSSFADGNSSEPENAVLIFIIVMLIIDLLKQLVSLVAQ
jgi:hypothetical protein